MILVNLCGAPGAGKSTGASYIFSMLKMRGVNAELVTEFAKDKTWEHNSAALSNQLYMAGKQYFRLTRCADQVDVIITDSPIFLTILYNNQQPADSRLPESFDSLIIDLYNRFDNLTYLIKRVKPYNPAGRNQTQEESDALHVELEELLKDCKIEYTNIEGKIADYCRVVDEVCNKLQK